MTDVNEFSASMSPESNPAVTDEGGKTAYFAVPGETISVFDEKTGWEVISINHIGTVSTSAENGEIESCHKANIELLLYGYKINCKALDYTAEFELFSDNNGPWESECSLTIKWDGCSNFNYQDPHFCGLEHFERFSKAIEFCYEFARCNIKEWMEL